LTACTDSTRASSDIRSISGCSGRSSGASMTKQTTPSAGMGQLSTIRSLNRAARSSAMRCRAALPACVAYPPT
jgi:hypothetical protein